MSSYINNPALSPGSHRTGVRASGYHIPTNSDSNEVPTFYHSPSAHTTPRRMAPSPLNPLWYLVDRRQAGLYSIPESDSYEVPVLIQTPSRHATSAQTTPRPQNPPGYLADRGRAGLYSVPISDSYEAPVFHRSPSRQATPYFQDERTSSVLNPSWSPEDRTHAGIYSVLDFPAQPNVVNGDTRWGFNPRLREAHQQSVPPRTSTSQSNSQAPTALENSRSRALSKLKKEIYDFPTMPTPKLLAKKLNFYYRDTKGVNALKEMENKEKEMNEGGKSCAVCLEDFVPKQEVMVTPCKHMFHEDCIVPWLRSQGQCPICRFVICEKERENPSSLNDDDVGRMAPSELIAGELLSILRAMEEAFQLGPEAH